MFVCLQLNTMTIEDLNPLIKGHQSKQVVSVSSTGQNDLPEVDLLESVKSVFPNAVFFQAIPPLNPGETATASEWPLVNGTSLSGNKYKLELFLTGYLTYQFFQAIPPLDQSETATASKSGDLEGIVQPSRDLFCTTSLSGEGVYTLIKTIWKSYKCSDEQVVDLERDTREQAVCPLLI